MDRDCICLSSIQCAFTNDLDIFTALTHTHAQRERERERKKERERERERQTLAIYRIEEAVYKI